MTITPKDALMGQLLAARDLGKAFMEAIDYIPGSNERTSAKARTEEAIAYIQKLIDEAK